MEPLDSKNVTPLSSVSPYRGTEGGLSHPFALGNVDRCPEVNDEMSLTIPDMTLTAKDLYNRYRLGTLPAEFVRAVLYDESDDFDSIVAENIDQFDLVDVDRELAKLRQKFEVMHGLSNIQPAKAGVDEADAKKSPGDSDAKPSNDSVAGE